MNHLRVPHLLETSGNIVAEEIFWSVRFLSNPDSG